jgi:hypothetical protein
MIRPRVFLVELLSQEVDVHPIGEAWMRSHSAPVCGRIGACFCSIEGKIGLN